MKRFIVKASILSALGDDGVERPGPGLAPTAFRIWKAGSNPTDKVNAIFTRESAERLMADQAQRGNLYSIDVDHLSLSEQAPPEARRAVGWHQLEVRLDAAGEPELWACAAEWTDVARCGLEKQPPEWRYFSPAFSVQKDTGEVTGYLNTALTNNPATWSVTSLATRASREEKIMDPEKKAAAIAAIKAAFGDDEKGAQAAIKTAFGSDDEEKPKEEEKKEETSEGEGSSEEKKDDDEEKKAAITATKELSVTVASLQSKVDTFEKEKIANERTTVLASRKDLPPALVKTLEKMPLSLMKETLAGIPVPVSDTAATVTATRGAGQGGTEEVRASRLPDKERKELRSRMGLGQNEAKIHWERSARVYPVITKAEARRVLERHGVLPQGGAK